MSVSPGDALASSDIVQIIISLSAIAVQRIHPAASVMSAGTFCVLRACGLCTLEVRAKITVSQSTSSISARSVPNTLHWLGALTVGTCFAMPVTKLSTQRNIATRIQLNFRILAFARNVINVRQMVSARRV